MEIREVKVQVRADDTQRLSGVVRYADGQEEVYWFDLPTAYTVTDSGSPWLACLLPLAVTLGEDLAITRPVDPELLRGAEGLVRIWTGWYPTLKPITVAAEAAVADTRANDAASFFSAGVDSFFTVLRFPHVKKWITCLGFDMPLRNRPAFIRHCRRLSEIAAERGTALIPVATNLRETRWRSAPWERVAFGAALAAVGLLFERHFNTVLVPGSVDYSTLSPWGSHPLTDPLFSTCSTRILHEGIGYGRFAKTEWLAAHDVALRNLHVCFRGQDHEGQDDQNCCGCEKCYRTMIALELLGVLDRCPLFDRRKFELSRISRIFCGSDIDVRYFAEMQEQAIRRNRRDIAAQIGAALARSRMVTRLALLSRFRLLWRLEDAARQRLLRNALR